MELRQTQLTANDELLFRTFFEDTYPRVKAYLYTLLGTNLHVDDIAQEVYIKLWNNWNQVDKSSALDSYLFTMVRNTVISHFRKTQREKQQQEMPVTAEAAVAANNVTDRMYHLDAILLYEETLQQVTIVKQRCFRLHREYGLTHREIAQREGISVKTVERYIQETVQLLKYTMQSHSYLMLVYAALLT